MSDLCWRCQKNSYALIRSANKSEEEKSIVSALIGIKKILLKFVN